MNTHKQEQAIFFSPFLKMKDTHYPEVKSISLQCSGREIASKQELDTFSSALANLLKASFLGANLKYSRNNIDIFDYTSLSSAMIYRRIDKLVALGWAKEIFRSKGQGKFSEVIATERLTGMFFLFSASTLPFYSIRAKRELVELRSKDKKTITYPSCELAQTRKQQLSNYNNEMKKHKVTLEQIELNTSLYSVFSHDDMKKGGRFYGSEYQCIPSMYRQDILINNRETIEVDYSSLHIRMLYDMDKIDIPEGDLYALQPNQSKEQRGEAKLASLITINSSTGKHGAILALADSLEEPYEYCKVLIESFMLKHQAISHHFFTGKGLYLQFLDSKIAILVLESLTIYLNIPVLCIHDSFIISKINQSLLEKEMLKAYKIIMGGEAKLTAK